MIGRKLTEAWGQPVIVENRPARRRRAARVKAGGCRECQALAAHRDERQRRFGFNQDIEKIRFAVGQADDVADAVFLEF